MKCPHKGNGPNWFPYKNNCYTFQMLHSRWDHYDNGQIQKTCQELGESEVCPATYRAVWNGCFEE